MNNLLSKSCLIKYKHVLNQRSTIEFAKVLNTPSAFVTHIYSVSMVYFLISHTTLVLHRNRCFCHLVL